MGALSFGGGFVIVPLMQADAVGTYHWMTHAQFLNAVALGQVTPGPLVQTVAAVGYAAGGLGWGAARGLVAFLPSFSLHPDRRRGASSACSATGARWPSSAGAAPAAAGAIVGSAVPARARDRQALAGAAVRGRRGRAARRCAWPVVPTLLGCGAVGALAALLGAPLG